MRTTSRSVVSIGLTAVVAVVLAACGGGTAPGAGASGSVPTTVSIGPAGGTLTSADGIVTLTVPKGALSKTLTFGIAPATSAPGGAVLAYELTPSGTTFAVPAKLSVDTGALTLPKGSTEADVRIETASNGAWHGLFTMLDSATHTASASLAHLSTYGIVAPTVTGTLYLAWPQTDPIVSASVDGILSPGSPAVGFQAQQTVQLPTVTPPAIPSCEPSDWLSATPPRDVSGGVQWSVGVPPPSSPSFPARAQDAFSIGGFAPDFTVRNDILASAGAGGSADAGFVAGNASAIYPFVFAVLDNPSGAQRTLSLQWTGRTSYNGVVQPSGPVGSADVEYAYETASGGCRGDYVVFRTPYQGKYVLDASKSFIVPSGAVKIWVLVRPAGSLEIPMDTLRTVGVQGTLNNELDVQIE